MKEQGKMGAVELGSLTAAEAARLSKENHISVHSGDSVVILKGSKLLFQEALDSKGIPRVFKDSNEVIRRISVVVVVIREDGTMTTAKVTLNWLLNADLFVEDTCPLELCKDGVRKYAATWKLTPVGLRNFELPIFEGQTEMVKSYCLKCSKTIQGFKEPDFGLVWKQLENGAWVNQDNLGDSIQLKAATRGCLEEVEMPTGKSLLNKLQKLQAAAETMAIKLK